MLNRSQLSRTSADQPPIVTLALSAIAIGLEVVGLGDWLAYDRTAICRGELWRLWSGHLTHWSTDHMLWDVLMFAALGATLELRGRRTFVACLAFSATAISAALWFALPQIQEYRGLSGIDSALFTLTALSLLAAARQARRPLVIWTLIVSLGGLAAKIGYEVFSGATLFVDSAADGFIPLPTVHAVGAAAGVLLAWFTAGNTTPADDAVESNSPCTKPSHGASDSIDRDSWITQPPATMRSARARPGKIGCWR